jgi:protein-S-isoprenylcysteine O-methyltransferase Ste14
LKTELVFILNLLIFILVSGVFIGISRRPLSNPNSHGFYRFFALEGILLLFLLNFPYWHENMLSPNQLLSWALFSISILFVIQGFLQLHKLGGKRSAEINPENFTFENTGKIVTDGIYRYIRHPMYSSLMLLTWGALLKHISVTTAVIALTSSLFLIATAKKEERENDLYFGTAYGQYMRKTKMFIPYIF